MSNRETPLAARSNEERELQRLQVLQKLRDAQDEELRAVQDGYQQAGKHLQFAFAHAAKGDWAQARSSLNDALDYEFAITGDTEVLSPLAEEWGVDYEAEVKKRALGGELRPDLPPRKALADLELAKATGAGTEEGTMYEVADDPSVARFQKVLADSADIGRRLQQVPELAIEAISRAEDELSWLANTGEFELLKAYRAIHGADANLPNRRITRPLARLNSILVDFADLLLAEAEGGTMVEAVGAEAAAIIDAHIVLCAKVLDRLARELGMDETHVN